MSEIQKCKQCGEVKGLALFRPYYNRDGYYKQCKDCERINQRHKYLSKKESVPEQEYAELQQIEELYELQRSLGLKPPRKRSTEGESIATSIVEKQMEALRQKKKLDIELTDETPDELIKWVKEELTGYHPDELEKVMFDLVDRYRPQIGFDDVAERPIYDDRHKEIIDKIQARFDDYEEEFY